MQDHYYRILLASGLLDVVKQLIAFLRHQHLFLPEALDILSEIGR